MIHIDRRHPDIGGAANPIRQAQYTANILNHTKWKTNHDLSRTVYDIMTEGLLRQYEKDKQDEITARHKERQRILLREQFEDYETALKIKETENRNKMQGNLDSVIMNELFRQMAAGRLTPVMTIDREGNISIRYELRNRENDVKHLTACQNNLSVNQFQDILAILVAQVEFNYNFVKFMENRKRILDVRDEELVQMFAGVVKASQANKSKAEQLRIEDEPKGVSRLLFRLEEKKDDRYDGQEEKTSRKDFGQDDFVNLSGSNCEMSSSMTSRKPPSPIGIELFHSKSTAPHMSSREPEPLGMLIEDNEKKRSQPDQHFSKLPRPQEHFSSGQDYAAQQDRAIDEIIKKEIEDTKKMQIRARQEIKNGKTGRTIFGQSFYPVPASCY